MDYLIGITALCFEFGDPHGVQIILYMEIQSEALMGRDYNWRHWFVLWIINLKGTLNLLSILSSTSKQTIFSSFKLRKKKPCHTRKGAVLYCYWGAFEQQTWLRNVQVKLNWKKCSCSGQFSAQNLLYRNQDFKAKI